jgi:hypothetical protein
MKGRKLTTLSFDRKFPENMLANDLETLLASFLTFGFSSLLNLFILAFRNQFSVDSKKIHNSTFIIHNFSATRSLALLALLLILISSSVGIIGFLVICLNRNCGLPKKSFSNSPSNFPFLKKFFTNRSSKE